MNVAARVEQGRLAFERRAWAEAHAALAGATEPDDLERLAITAVLLGKDADDVMERAHQAHLRAGDAAGAARCAFWLGIRLATTGEAARGGGWIARAHRVLGDLDAVEQGYLLIPAGRLQLDADPGAALENFIEVVRVADRFGDPDLMALGLLGQGQSLLKLGRAPEGLALLDETMVAVESGEVAPIPSGIIYCAVIASCQEISDLRRARVWTTALTGWCAAQPDVVPFRGQCLIHRSEILQLNGAWSDAMHEALRACDQLPSGHPAIGAAHYQCGELHRLRGELPEAEEAYRLANQWGHSPQPGLAQLRLAQGQVEAARAAVQRVLDETHDAPSRSRMLPAAVEIALADADADAARAAADELRRIAADLGTPLLSALATHLHGAVRLVEGDAAGAAEALQRAATAWRELEAPYEAARARVLIGLACRELGDADSADLELDAARVAFEDLGAAPELTKLRQLAVTGAAAGGGTTGGKGLTDRELEVLRLIAAGKTNQAIADDLVISTHTVARHVQNIFTKLDVPSRTAAAAYAFEHALV